MAKANIIQQVLPPETPHTLERVGGESRAEARVAASQPTARSPKGEAAWVSVPNPREGQGPPPWSFNDRSQHTQRQTPRGRVLSAKFRLLRPVAPQPRQPKPLRSQCRAVRANAGVMPTEAGAAPRRCVPRRAREGDCIYKFRACAQTAERHTTATHRLLTATGGPQTISSNREPRRLLVTTSVPLRGRQQQPQARRASVWPTAPKGCRPGAHPSGCIASQGASLRAPEGT